MSFNAAKQGRHAGTHQDQYRTAKQARLDAKQEVEDRLAEACDRGCQPDEPDQLHGGTFGDWLGG